VRVTEEADGDGRTVIRPIAGRKRPEARQQAGRPPSAAHHPPQRDTEMPE